MRRSRAGSAPVGDSWTARITWSRTSPRGVAMSTPATLARAAAPPATGRLASAPLAPGAGAGWLRARPAVTSSRAAAVHAARARGRPLRPCPALSPRTLTMCRALRSPRPAAFGRRQHAERGQLPLEPRHEAVEALNHRLHRLGLAQIHAGPRAAAPSDGRCRPTSAGRGSDRRPWPCRRGRRPRSRRPAGPPTRSRWRTDTRSTATDRSAARAPTSAAPAAPRRTRRRSSPVSSSA